MTKAEFKKAVRMVEGGNYNPQDISIFYGFATPYFKSVCCTMNQIANLIGWQARCFDGTWDTEALNEIFDSRKRFRIID